MFPTTNFFGNPTATYTLCLLSGLIAVFVAALLFRPKEFPLIFIFSWLVIVISSAFVGSMLLNIILYGSEYKVSSIVELIKVSGLAYLGAPMLGFLVLWIHCRLIGVPFLAVADFVAPLFMLERAIGRVGCLAYGCCYGIPSNLPWAYPFKSWGIPNIVPRHPTQAYELIFVLAIFVSSSYLYKKIKDIRGVPNIENSQKKSVNELRQMLKKAPSGGIVFFYVWLCYGFLRFWNEFLRAEGPFIYGIIKISHIILLSFTVISAMGLFVIIKNSPLKGGITRALKGALIRLAVWLIVISAIVLSAISLYNY